MTIFDCDPVRENERDARTCEESRRRHACPGCSDERVIPDPFGAGLVPCPLCNADQRTPLSRAHAERDRLLRKIKRLNRQLLTAENVIDGLVIEEFKRA